ncbi:hypothetical protein [Myxosarcina sp. GI1]|uniref:hypothetical protein n=1 Tax=Myxosarcina sp. GI1 TaxID=1541065 RepID=UPI00055F554F|nr:hypothetical protein [Myxosarcina sp. GI1]
MKKTNAKKDLFLLLKNNLVQFVVGMLACCFFLKLATHIPDRFFATTFKTFGFGIFFYWTTPFVVYWLAYVSASKLKKVSLIITTLIVGTYSYIFWDSYFFFKELMNWIITKPSVTY